MSAIAEARAALEFLAGPEGYEKTRIDRARQAVVLPGGHRLSYSRAFNLWYSRAKRIDAHELDAIRAARRKQEAKRNEAFRAFHERIARIEQELAELRAEMARTPLPMAGGQAGRIRRTQEEPGDPLVASEHENR